MRNPNRIRPLLDALAAAWEKCPDLRLGQLIENATFEGTNAPLFYIEDEALIKLIENYMNENYSPSQKALRGAHFKSIIDEEQD